MTLILVLSKKRGAQNDSIVYTGIIIDNKNSIIGDLYYGL